MTPTSSHVAGSPRQRRISAVRNVVIGLPCADVLAVVRDIGLLEPLERKARHVEIHPTGPDEGWYRIVGKLFGIRSWTGDFSYEQHACGWHSEDLRPRVDGWRISGGFLVSRIDDTTSRVTHYEDYTIPHRLRHWRPLLWLYMRRSQVGEMRDLLPLVLRTAASQGGTPAHPTAGTVRLAEVELHAGASQPGAPVADRNA